MRRALTFASILAWSSPVSAQSPPTAAPTTRKAGYSRYERATIDVALTKLRATLDPEPEGKIVESIHIVRLEVIDAESAPLTKIPIVGPALKPEVLNRFHATTKEWVVRRELMMKEGEPYQQTLLDESTRNLRALSELSLVVGVPLRGSSPDKVRILVVTKDIWSLRLAFDFSITPGGLETLSIQPSEINVAGTHHTASSTFTLNPKAFSLGAGYTVPRFGTSYVGAVASAGLIINRERGEPEGSAGALAVTKPLYTTLVPWAWQVKGEWNNSVTRRFVNAQLATYDARDTPEREAIPFEYRNRRVTVGAALTRSFGWAYKTDLSLGYEFNRRAFATFDQPDVSALAMDEFRRRFVPTSDTRSIPYAQLRLYTTNFHRITDLETLALQEDYRLGYDVYTRIYPVTRAFGSTRDFVGHYFSAQYTFPLGDGLTRFGVETTTEGTPDQLTDASIRGVMRVATPSFVVGRVVLDLAVMNRYRNYLNNQTFLGGDDRLRGFPSNFLVGKDYMMANLEFRARPVDILSLQVAPVLFFDAGDAATSWQALSPKQAAGFGLRALIPQLNRVVMRGDLGFPLTRPLPPGVTPVSFFISFEQAVEFGSFGPT